MPALHRRRLTRPTQEVQPISDGRPPEVLRGLGRDREQRQLQLDAIRISEHEYRPLPHVRDPRVLHSYTVEVLGPGFEVVARLDS